MFTSRLRNRQATKPSPQAVGMLALGFAARLANRFTDRLFKHSSPILIPSNSIFSHSIAHPPWSEKSDRFQD
jgi:hypothetical protein